MNPNNLNHFETSAVGVDRKRSRFHRPSSHLTTFNSGKLIPLYVDEILPGDNISITTKALCRMATPIFPVMDNAFLDLYAFFVPNRLVWDKWKEFMGENNTDYWTQDEVYEIPQIYFGADTGLRDLPSAEFTSDVLGYMGVPPVQNQDGGDVSVNALPVRAYVKIWNDWFRNQNLQVPAHLYTDSTNRNYNKTGDPIVTAELGGDLLPVSKFKDYFTSSLPGAQKGAPVQLPLGLFAPVITRDEEYLSNSNNQPVLRFRTTGGQLEKDFYDLTACTRGKDSLANNYGFLAGIGSNVTPDIGNSRNFVPSNLYADLQSATASTVNQLRLAFQTQKYLETLARSGSRYIESLYSLYGVRASDKSLQRSEYLGGVRVPISMTSVAQTSASDNTTPQGNLSAFSVTGLDKHLVNNFFEEHGYLIICGCVRVQNKYSQGIEKMWSRKQRFDFFAPVFNNLGEMPVLNKEIYLTGTSQDDEVFGYQEAWVEYRTKSSRLSGYMPAWVYDSLGAWHYGSNFANLPVLSSAFISENSELIDRTLAVTSDSSHQFLLDLYIDNYSTRVMSMYSVPGLIDHA